MTRRRPDNRDEQTSRTIPTPRLDDPSAVRGAGMPASDHAEAQQPTGIVGDASASAGESRSGVDTRRRGWFWHWNSIVTQFAPIIGLKGVGLLNSYTVWTDRREDSAYRGFAFPSQQSEADFYGEDRNELITINKILVALDLIEIRKEMVHRTDAKGRRWKVPHNLYRVKDHGDEFNLTVHDVRRVVALADKDRAVYRYVRRIFSPKFAPIDRDNVWHQILEELQSDPTWQKLAARTEKDESRASARTKAGHAARKSAATEASGDFSLPTDGDSATDVATAPDSSDDSATGDTNDSDDASETSAAKSNNGLATVVATTSNGFDPNSASTAEPVNNDPDTFVDPGSTTYYQELTTTTTHEEERTDTAGYGPGIVPDDRREREATLRLFDEANDREANPAARRQLDRIADRFAGLAAASGNSPWELVGNAIDEAVASGSAFVAPKRIREILTRWERDGVPDLYAGAAQIDDAPAQPVTSAVTGPVTGRSEVSHSFDRTPAGSRDKGGRRQSTLPVDRDPAEIWDAACGLMQGSLSATVIARLRKSVAIVGYDAGIVSLTTGSDELARGIEGDWQDVIQRKLGVMLRRPVRIAVVAPDDPDDTSAAPDSVAAARSGAREGSGRREVRPAAAPSRTSAVARPEPVRAFSLPECGMTSTQVWVSVVDDLRGSGAIPKPEVDAWLRDSVLLGRDEDGTLIVGVPHALAERRAARFRDAIETAAMHVVGYDCAIRVVRTQAWLSALSESTGTEG